MKKISTNTKLQNKQTSDQIQELEKYRLAIEKHSLESNHDLQSLCKSYLHLSKKIQHLQHIGESHFALASYQFNLHKYSYATKNLVQTLLHSCDQSLLDRAYEMLIAIYSSIHKNVKPLDHFYETLRAPEGTIFFLVQYHIGVYHFKQKEFAAAIHFYQEALGHLKSNKELSTAILNDLGRSYLELNDLKNALKFLSKAHQANEKNKDKSQELLNDFHFALLFAKQEKYAEAYAKLLTVYDCCKIISNETYRYSCVFQMATVASSLSLSEKAEDHFQEGIALIKDVDERKYLEILGKYLEFLKQIKNFKKSIAYYKEYIRVEDSIIKQEKEIEIKALTVKYKTQEQELEIARLKTENDNQMVLLAQAEQIKKTNDELIRINMNLEAANSELMETKILRAQMNPHFVYNTLNSISSLIKTKRNAEAQKYLNEFSSLTRQIFDSNSTKNISLQEELDFCERYILLEKLRFRDKFRYELIVDDRINCAQCEIPSMIIQPLLENSIKHGVFHLSKKEIGVVTLEIKLIKDQILLQLTDNGIGTKLTVAQIVKSKRESSLSIINKRLNLFNSEPLSTTSISMANLKSGGIQIKFTLNYKPNVN